MTAELGREDSLARMAESIEGVAGLHGGQFGEVATYLPGRKIIGIRITDSGCDVHVAVAYPADVRAVARGVRLALQPHIDVPVTVTVEDVVITGDKT